MMSWDITNKCNIRCRHCFNNSGDVEKYDFSQEMSDSECINLAKDIASIKPQQVCICGGETLLRACIYDIIKILSGAGICVNMVSNGLLLNDEVAVKLKKAGINDIQISVDGLASQHDVFRNRKGAFKQAINAIESIKKAGLSPVVSFCPNRYNFMTFPLYVDYMHKMGVRSIRMMPLLPMGRGKINYDELLLDSRETFDFVCTLNGLREKYDNLEIEWGDPLEHLYIVRASKRKYPIVISIGSSGKISITPYLPIYVGNIRKHSIGSYWKAGLNTIWRREDVYEVIRKMNTVCDFETEILPLSLDLCEE